MAGSDDAVGKPPRGRPRDQDSAETRRRLLDAARELFTQHGYEMTSNRRVAAVCRVTPNVIYHYFGSKAELYAEVHREVLEQVFDTLDCAVATQPDLLGRYVAALEASAEMSRVDPSVQVFVMSAEGDVQRYPELLPLLRPVMRRVRAFFEELVDGAVARHELREGVNEEALRDLLWAVMLGLGRFTAITLDNDRHEAVVAVLKEFMNGSLVADQTAAGRR